MAKRFSETKIWEDTWYQELPLTWKLVWKYLCDKCNEAGIWKVNLKLADFQLNLKIKWNEIDKYINNGKLRIHKEQDVWIIVDFIEFQYGNKIFESPHPFHQKIKKMIEKHPFDRVSNTLHNTFKEEIREEVKEEVKETIKKTNTVSEIFAYFCEKTGRKLVLSNDRKKILQDRIKEGATLDDMKKAVDNFVDDDWADRHGYNDIVYCLGVRNKINNYEKWRDKQKRGYNGRDPKFFRD